MSTLSPNEAASLLEDADLVPCVTGGLRDVKELLGACLEAGIPAALGADESCTTGGCATKAQLVVRPEDVDRVRALMRERWVAAVEDLGVDVAQLAKAHEIPAEGDLPCPACGTAAPLVGGACSDCGLQLE